MSEDWRDLPPEGMLAMRDRVASRLAHQGISTCRDVTPGALICRLDKSEVQRPHLEKIDEAFQKVHEGVADRILALTPPQVGKSRRGGVAAPFWWLTHHPKDPIVLASYGQGLADARGRAVRALVEQHGAQFGLHLDPRTTAANNWLLTTGGGMRCVGVGAGLTGHSASLAIVDDPHKDRVEAESKTIRDGIHDWWSSTLISRMAPGAPIVLIQTRWHPDDLAGRLLKEEGRLEDGGRWVVVELPALAVDHPLDDEGARTCSCAPEAVHDALGRLPGEPLPHPKIPLADKAAALAHWEDKRRSSTIRDWHALYQAEPVTSEGALVSADLLRNQRHYDSVSPPRRTGVAVDPSGGGKDACGIIGGHLGHDGKLWWTHDRSGVMPSKEWGRAVCELAYEINADVIVFENNFGGDQASTIIGLSWDALRLEGKVQGLKPRVVSVNARKNKVIRAEPTAQALQEDRIRLGASLPNLESEWYTYQLTSPTSPGRLDASVYLTSELLPDAGSEASIGIPRGSREEAPAPTSTLARAKVGRPVVRVGNSRAAAYSRARHLRAVPQEEAG